MECDAFYFVSESDFSSSTMSKFGIDPIAQHVSFKIFWWCVWPFCYKFSCQNLTLNRFYLITQLEHLKFFHYDFVSFLHSISSDSSRIEIPLCTIFRVENRENCSFCIMAIVYFINWILAADTIKGGKLFKGGNYPQQYGNQQ